MAIDVIRAEKYDNDLKAFLAAVREAMARGETPFILQDDAFEFAAVPGEKAQEVIVSYVADRLASNPEGLKELSDRITTGELKDWE